MPQFAQFLLLYLAIGIQVIRRIYCSKIPANL